MNPESLLLHASDLMQEFKFCGCVRAHLCLWEDGLRVRAASHTLMNHPIFLTFTESALESGLTIQDWNILETNLWNFFKDKI